MATSKIKRNKADYSGWKESAYFSFTRRGNTVQLRCFSTLPATADNTQFDTIPLGYRPPDATDTPVFSTSGTFLGVIRLKNDGVVQPAFGALKAGNARFTLTYVCD